MFRLVSHTSFDFLSIRNRAYLFSFLIAIPGLLLLLFRGLNESIEFTGGTLIQVHAQNDQVTTSGIRSALEAAGITGAEIQAFGSENEFIIRARLSQRGDVTSEATQATAAAVDTALTDAFGEEAYRVSRTEAVGPKVGGELRLGAVLALLIGFTAVLIYLSLRIEWRFGMAAVLAAVHDIVVTIGFVSLLNLEVSLVVVAALLLIVGYSLNDTIITFDRVRENLKRYKRDHFYEILNRSINETLPRTVLTSGTTLAATLALLIFGGAVIRDFAWVVTFGIVIGTFSSIFIASPILLIIERKWPGEDVRGARSMTRKNAKDRQPAKSAAR